jgi:DNA-binding IclR family transcriptional regulator
VTEEEVFAFARNTIRSVWALELLLLLRKDRGRDWTVDELVRELRSSEAVTLPCLDVLKSAGLVSGEAGGRFRYAAASEDLDAVSGELAKIYAAKPMALAKAIMRAPNEKLTIFSDAFKLKGDE